MAIQFDQGKITFMQGDGIMEEVSVLLANRLFDGQRLTGVVTQNEYSPFGRYKHRFTAGSMWTM